MRACPHVLNDTLGPASVFLWEWFTTKPYADSGEVRFIGSVYSMSASQSCDHPEERANLMYRCSTMAMLDVGCIAFRR